MPRQRLHAEHKSISDLRIAKRIRPNRNGAKRFALRYGDQLVCVRHRLSADSTIRYTTVELVIEQTPVVPAGDRLIALRLNPRDQFTRSLLLASGGRWDDTAKQWLVARKVAKSLGLLDKIVRKGKPT